MKKFLVISAIALATFSAFCAGTKKFGKMKDSDWVVTNAWQAMQHRVKPDSEWATNHFGSAEFSNAVGRVQIPGAGGGCDTNAVDALANSAVVTNALTVATTNRVALLESSKADKSALAAHVANTDNPHAVTAAQVGAVGIGERIDFAQDMGEGIVASSSFDTFLLMLDNPNYLGCAYHRGGNSEYYPPHGSDMGSVKIGHIPGYDGPGVFISHGSTTKYLHHSIEQWNQDGGLYTLLYFPEGQQGMLALQNWQ